MNKLRLLLSATAVVLIAVTSSPLLNRHHPYFSSLTKLWLRCGDVADLVVTNETIYTSDAAFPFADSMAVRGGRILRVGKYSSMQDLAGSETKILNLLGKLVVPGFIDSHVHLLFGGLQLARVQLQGISRKDQFVKKVKDAISNMQPGTWLLGGGWNNDLWGGELPMASWIDDITPHNPVWLTRMDGHMGLANSLALNVAGISSNTVDPDGGVVVRNSVGEPTGLLIDSAMKLVLSCIPEDSVEERREALLRASDHALMRGVTTVVDVGRYFPGASPELSWEDLSDVYRWADLSGKMKIRVCLYFPMETWTRLQELINQAGRKLSQWIYLGGVKSFADGSLGSNSALFYEPYVDEPLNHGLQVADIDTLYNMTISADKAGLQPYVDEPLNHGLQVADIDTLYNMTISADKAGLQVAIHAIGDQANDMILDLYKSVASENGMKDRRFRNLQIEHAQHLAPGAAARFGEQQVVASVQPDHLLDDADSATKKLGLERSHGGSYLFCSLLAGNAQLALGSDWPVADINPLRSIKTAIERVPPGWENAWIPSECISLHDALNGYTISAAHACFLDEDVGSLSPGKMADFVILSSDSWDKFAAGASASVEATYVGGLLAYSRNLEEDL
ncbi:N-substituted formamide deformylase [Handroanthus impetiginosus]|uniref:N-substituted formamide deformylase n=1 Tax=Handroanthus impetiginosus TaxID=429701 RepID=A0A2G9HWT2_9LAMI|nr:N-substituted formamide deformylase [Handroanthus impetiginosus]